MGGGVVEIISMWQLPKSLVAKVSVPSLWNE